MREWVHQPEPGIASDSPSASVGERALISLGRPKSKVRERQSGERVLRGLASGNETKAAPPAFPPSLGEVRVVNRGRRDVGRIGRRET